MTRAILFFCHGTDKEAAIYINGDGYPDDKFGVHQTFARFFTENEKQTKGTDYGTRFEDASYLAARYIVWQSIENRLDYARHPNDGWPTDRPLGFISLGIVPIDRENSDIDYIYTIDCDNRDANGFPTVAQEQDNGS